MAVVRPSCWDHVLETGRVHLEEQLAAVGKIEAVGHTRERGLL